LGSSSLIKPKRKIEGISAILLPFSDSQGAVDWNGFENSLHRTVAAGLIPAVNMDTGYVNLIDQSTRLEVLNRTRAVCDGHSFVAGSFVESAPGVPFEIGQYQAAIDTIVERGGVPVIFQSFGLTSQSDDKIVECYRQIGQHCQKFIAFELGDMFAPFGKIYSLDVYRELMSIDSCVGAKHSSLDRQLEWDRICLRDEVRPEFKVYTGNDLAIDMVMYGSDYLLGLSAFAPDLFALRDQYWLTGDDRFFQLNDVLQYLGHFAFRNPVPAYKHSAAMFLKLTGAIENDFAHPEGVLRPESDRAVLDEILVSLEPYLKQHGIDT
jgi:dihydrodipicolinate synthase/N-acetylneuraminate lyase